MIYEDFINNILNVRGRFNCGDEYHERHHIIPKCCGGSDDTDNLVDLFAEEHFIAHRLLALENPDNYKLVYAWWCMAFVKDKSQNRYEMTPEEYKEVKTVFSKTMSGKDGPRSGENHYRYGTHLSEELKRKLSESHKGKSSPKKGTHLSEEQKKKISKSRRGKKYTEEQKQKLQKVRQEKQSGSNHPMAKEIVQCDINNNLVDVWNYALLIENETSISRGDISMCCRGKRKTAGGFTWKYLYDQTDKDGNVILGAISLGIITEEEALEHLNNKTK